MRKIERKGSGGGVGGKIGNESECECEGKGGEEREKEIE